MVEAVLERPTEALDEKPEVAHARLTRTLQALEYLRYEEPLTSSDLRNLAVFSIWTYSPNDPILRAYFNADENQVLAAVLAILEDDFLETNHQRLLAIQRSLSTIKKRGLPFPDPTTKPFLKPKQNELKTLGIHGRTDEQKAIDKEVYKLLQEGLNMKEIKTLLPNIEDAAFNSALKYLKRQGLVKSVPRISKADRDLKIERLAKAKELYKLGRTRKQICHEMNLSWGVVSHLIYQLKQTGEV